MAMSGTGLLAGLASAIPGAIKGYQDMTAADLKKQEVEAKAKADKEDREIKKLSTKLEAEKLGVDLIPGENGELTTRPKAGFLTPQQKRKEELFVKGFQYDEGGALKTADWKQQEIQNKGLLQREQLDLARSRATSAQQSAAMGKRPTEGQFKAATFAKRLEDAEGVFGQLEQGGYDPTALKEQATGKLSGIFGEGVKSNELKQLQQAQRNFINAVLRRESGAAIAPTEFESAAQQYFPQTGDTPEVLAQKKANRQIAMTALQAEGSPATGLIEEKQRGLLPKQAAPQSPKMSGQDQQALEWAQANASDPRAKQILQRLGM